MGELVKFNFGQVEISTITDRQGDPWFVAKEVCDVLGLGNVGQAVTSLDDDEKNTITINDGIPGNPNRLIINEPGLYDLVLRSRKPEARAFKRWVKHEVLPKTRKTGSYGKDPIDVSMALMRDPAYLRAMLLTYSEKKNNGRLPEAMVDSDNGVNCRETEGPNESKTSSCSARSRAWYNGSRSTEGGNHPRTYRG